MVRVKVLEDRATVYSQAETTSPVIAELAKGQEFNIGPAATFAGVSWCTAVLPDGRRGYVLGAIKIYRVRQVTLNQQTVEVLEWPAVGSTLVWTYHRGERFTVCGVVAQGDMSWVEVRTLSGAMGYIPANTKILEDRPGVPVQRITAKSLARQKLVRGIVWLAGGVTVTVISYLVAALKPHGGTFIIAWGAMIVGGFQFVKGLIGYYAAS
jgi:hypothetical protein